MAGLAAGGVSTTTDVGAALFMDDVVTPISDPCPIELVKRSIRVAQVLDDIAAEFGFVILYGIGKTELTLVLRGPETQ